MAAYTFRTTCRHTSSLAASLRTSVHLTPVITSQTVWQGLGENSRRRLGQRSIRTDRSHQQGVGGVGLQAAEKSAHFRTVSCLYNDALRLLICKGIGEHVVAYRAPIRRRNQPHQQCGWFDCRCRKQRRWTGWLRAWGWRGNAWYWNWHWTYDYFIWAGRRIRG
jgi:hypothetical protein